MTSESPAGKVVVAIDGPAGVGKSTVARSVARELGLSYLDTGAMYRAVGLVAQRGGVDAVDEAAVRRLIDSEPISLQPDRQGVARILADGEDIESAIRTSAVGLLASEFASRPQVRRYLVSLQQEFGLRHGAVLEGRDIGTVVFPETPHKFFLEARPEVRAARRIDQLRGSGRPVDEEEIRQEILERDRRDRGRSDSPLRADSSYLVIDTSDLALDEVVRRILGAIRTPSD